MAGLNYSTRKRSKKESAAHEKAESKEYEKGEKEGIKEGKDKKRKYKGKKRATLQTDGRQPHNVFGMGNKRETIGKPFGPLGNLKSAMAKLARK